MDGHVPAQPSAADPILPYVRTTHAPPSADKPFGTLERTFLDPPMFVPRPTEAKKEDAKAATEDKQFNVAVTQHDSIFKNIALPGGISTKATEYRDLAAKGDRWESPIFSIGSSRETSNLPRIPNVSRKPHNVNTEGVVGKNAPNSQSNYGNDGTSGYGHGSSTTGHHGAGLTGQGSQPGYGSSAQSGYGNTTQSGYGNTTQSGYGNTAQSGYGNTAQPGYGNTGAESYESYPNSGGYGTSNTGSGLAHRGVEGHSGQAPGTFGNEVDSASKPSSGEVFHETTGNTILGKNNPVLNGLV